MKQRNFVTTGDSIGTNPVVNTDAVLDEKKVGKGAFLTEKEVLDRADKVKREGVRD